MKYIIAFILAFTFYSIYAYAQNSSEPFKLNKQKLYLSLDDALKEPEKVYRLCLGGQGLTSIPEAIDNLINLQDINMSQNSFDSLPESFYHLSNLQILNLSANNLKAISQKFSRLQNLKKLDVSTNSNINWTQTLPVIFKLKNLEELNISYNEINKIPNEISNLRKLKTLDLSGCKLSNDEKNKLKNKLKKVKIIFD